MPNSVQHMLMYLSEPVQAAAWSLQPARSLMPVPMTHGLRVRERAVERAVEGTRCNCMQLAIYRSSS